MKKVLLLLIVVVLLLQAAFVIYKNRAKDDLGLLPKDPWTVAGLAEDVEVQEVKAAAPAPYPGAKATNPSLGRGVLRGRVVDLTGEPKREVAVVADQHRDSAPALTLGLRHAARWATETDDTGCFEFTTLSGGVLTVSAFTPTQHAMGEVALDEGGAAAEIRLTLVDTVQLGGRVYSPDGMATRDAWVYPVACDTRPGALPYARFPQKTDREGHFDFTHLCEGNWRLLVATRQYAPFLSDALDPAAGDASLNLCAGATLMGEVVEVTEDRSEGRVEIFARESAYGLETYRTRTDGRGHFELAGLRPATYTLTISAGRVAPVYNPIVTTVSEGVSELPPIWVKPAGSVRGRVVLAGSDGRGIPDATVEAAQAGPEPLTATTDLGGYYLFGGLAEGTCSISVVPPAGYAPTASLRDEVTIVPGQQTPGPDFALERGLTVSGRVEDSEGSPVPQANVYLSLEGRGGEPLATRTNDSGLFAFKGAGRTESVTLQARRMDRGSIAAGPFEMNGESLMGLVLTLDVPCDLDAPSGE